MSEHIVILSIEIDEGQSDPDKWDWANVIDSPYPVGVIASVEVDDNNIDLVMNGIETFVMFFYMLFTRRTKTEALNKYRKDMENKAKGVYSG
jgi:hypothetical protein